MAPEFTAGPEPGLVSHTNRQNKDLLNDLVQAQAERTDKRSPLMDASGLTFPQISALLIEELPSESSRRVYRNTFLQWERFASEHKFSVMDLFYDNVKSFLYSRNLSYSTRLSRKSHMQRLLRIVSYLDPSFGIHYIQLRDLTIETTSKDNAPRREPRVLSTKECQQLLAVWKTDRSHKGIRNYAIICLLVHTAVRNAELVALRWEDLNWNAQTLTVWRGKQGQHSTVTIRDSSPETLNSLRRLQDAQQSVRSYDDMPFRLIFPALSTGKNARFHSDKVNRTSTQTIRQVVKQTAENAGLGTLSSSDLRHTSLTMFAQADDSDADMPSSADS